MRVDAHIAVVVIQVGARARFGFEAFVSARQGRCVGYICQVGDLAVVGITELVDDAPLAIGAANYTVAVHGQGIGASVIILCLIYVDLINQLSILQISLLIIQFHTPF